MISYKKNGMLFFFVATIIVIGWAAYTVNVGVKPEYNKEQVQRFLIEGLGAKIANVNALTLQGNETLFEIKQSDGKWMIANKSDYKIDSDLIRQIVTKISELEILEEKTNNKERFAILGVDNPEEADSLAVRVSLFTGDKNNSADIVIGTSRRGGVQQKSLYARKFDEDQVWLVASDVNSLLTPNKLLEAEVFQWEYDSIKRVIVNDSGSGNDFTISREKEGHNFDIEKKPASFKQAVKKGAVNKIASKLKNIKIVDVTPVGDIKFSRKDSRYLTFENFSGVKLKVTSIMDGGKLWIKLKASSDNEAAAADINDLTEDWAYALSDSQKDEFIPDLNNFLENK